ncbi:uncharacterized protein cubi_01178 [Cryptosporidium ubiquitum]|uniref:Uncharacterized protein n=1 Tax=Cryptosporidium ubiquitum TaxID=857276 RepID=A0A1J4MJF5_9CRYT|nr:uncharacterized protein cubi_01178 [Cryptosporidium ubiquitum]OII74334.1 hypothetical protein cubi_01178 [Cryptosporidium ubiquitum]
MNTLQKSQSQVMGIRPIFPVKSLLSISSSDFEHIWKEVKWDTKRVNSTLDLFSRFCRDDLDILPSDYTLSSSNHSNNGNGTSQNQLMSNHRLMALLKSIAIVGIENDDFNMDFFSRNDLCVIMTGIPYIDKKSFLRLMCLLDRSTPHTTTSPAGISRLKLVFSYYDWGWKGYLDESDWKRLRSDILNLTYYGKLYDGNNNQDFKSGLNRTSKIGTPMPETLEEGLKQLSREVSIRSLKSANNGSRILKNDSLRISINASDSSNMNNNAGHSEYSYFDNSNNSYVSSVPYSVQNKDLIIDFPLFIKLVEFRIIKGTSQILRVELPGKDQEEFVARSIMFNGGSIFLENYKHENEQYSPDKSRNASKYYHVSPSAQNLKSKVNSPSKINPESGEIDNIEKNKQIINEQIQELDNELNNLKITVKNSHHPSNSMGIDISNLAEDKISSNAIESIFGPPPEDLHGIFCDKPNYQEDLAFSSIVVPSSSTPVRKSRSIRSDVLPITPSANNDPISEQSHNSNSFSTEKVTSNSFPNNITNTETGGPPILL